MPLWLMPKIIWEARYSIWGQVRAIWSEVIRTFEAATGRRVPYQIKDRRPGDIDTCYADPAKAESQLGWAAKLGLKQMCRDGWRWQENQSGDAQNIANAPRFSR